MILLMSSVRKSRTGALNEVRLLIDTGGRGFGLDVLLNLMPGGEQEMEVADEVPLLLPLANRADDDSHAIGDGQGTQDFAEPLTFAVVLDLAGDAALVAEGHEDEGSDRAG